MVFLFSLWRNDLPFLNGVERKNKIYKIDMRNGHTNVVKSSYIVSKHIMFLMLCKSSLWDGYNLS